LSHIRILLSGITNVPVRPNPVLLIL